jgi:endonuclease-3
MLPLPELVDHLARLYGEPAPAPQRSLLELVVWENVAYLADDAARTRAFALLHQHVGLDPARLMNASDEMLAPITSQGILAAHQSEKLREIGRITLEQFGGDLDVAVRDRPLPQARRALQRYPSIGEPGAEKILLFGRMHPVLGLESNAVRVLCRVGLVHEARSYSATYRDVQRLGTGLAGLGFDWLIRAHLLLRQHGRELCRRSRPMCGRCPLTDACDFYIAASPRV